MQNRFKKTIITHGVPGEPKQTIWPLAVLIVTLCSSCTKDNNSGAVIARVGKSEITQTAFEKRLEKFTMLTPVDNERVRDALVQAMIDERVLLLEAERRGLRETSAFKQQARAVHLDAVLDAYRDALADARTVVKEEDIQKAYVLANEQAAARYLYAPTLAQADSLYAQLQAGVAFDALAAQVFRDYRLANNGGYLGFFKWDDMDPTFAAVAQKLRKGEISKPIRTRYGYGIIKLEDRIRTPLLTETEYAKHRKKLAWIVEHRKRAEAILALDAETLAMLHLQFNDDVVAQLWRSVYAARRDSSQDDAEKRDSTIPPPTAVIVTVAGKPWTLEEFQQRALQTSARQRAKVQTIQDLQDFIRGLALRDEYLARAKRAGFENRPEVRQRASENADSFLMEMLGSIITDSVQVPLDSLRKKYAEDPGDYIQPPMARLREITVASRETADTILKKAKAGVNFSDLAKRYSIRRWAAERGGDIGYATEADLGALGEAIFKLKAGEIGGVYQQDEYFTIVKVVDYLPARQRSFAEAKSEIEEMLLPAFRQRALQQVIAKLREPLDIEVNRAVMGQVQSPL